MQGCIISNFQWWTIAGFELRTFGYAVTCSTIWAISHWLFYHLYADLLNIIAKGFFVESTSGERKSLTDPNYFSINSIWNSENYWLAITDDWKTSDSLNLENKEKWIKFVADLDTGSGNSPKRLLSNLVRKQYLFLPGKIFQQAKSGRLLYNVIIINQLQKKISWNKLRRCCFMKRIVNSNFDINLIYFRLKSIIFNLFSIKRTININ